MRYTKEQLSHEEASLFAIILPLACVTADLRVILLDFDDTEALGSSVSDLVLCVPNLCLFLPADILLLFGNDVEVELKDRRVGVPFWHMSAT